MVFSLVSGLRQVLKLLKQLFNELLERRMQLKTFEFNSLFIHCTDPNQLQTITPSLAAAGGLNIQYRDCYICYRMNRRQQLHFECAHIIRLFMTGHILKVKGSFPGKSGMNLSIRVFCWSPGSRDLRTTRKDSS